MRVRVCVPLLVLMYYSRYLGRNTLESKYTTSRTIPYPTSLCLTDPLQFHLIRVDVGIDMDSLGP